MLWVPAWKSLLLPTLSLLKKKKKIEKHLYRMARRETVNVKMRSLEP
jgi:hypothetical protein